MLDRLFVLLTAVISSCLCPHSHAGECPRGPARADDHHGCLCLQTAVPSVKLSRVNLPEIKTARCRAIHLHRAPSSSAPVPPPDWRGKPSSATLTTNNWKHPDCTVIHELRFHLSWSRIIYCYTSLFNMLSFPYVIWHDFCKQRDIDW